jgi:hypothetical protein
MRGRAPLASVLVTAMACGRACGPLYPCAKDSDCPGPAWYCDPTLHACWGRPDAGSYCEPLCTDYQECTDNVCSERYQGVEITSPITGSQVDASVTVVATLVLASGAQSLDPSTLSGTATADAGTIEMFDLARVDAGTFQGTWYPQLETRYALQVAWVDAGLVSPFVDVSVDTTPPTFLVSIPIPTRPDASYQDPALPGAWRRDEVAPLTVTSSASDIDPTSVEIDLYGLSQGDAGPPVAFHVTSFACDAGYCGLAQVDFATVEMNAFDGTLQAVVEGRDRAGNLGTIDAGISLSRWKWMFSVLLSDGGIERPSLPAVGLQGDVYSTAAGGLFALHADGSLKWAWFSDAGTASYPYAIGRSNGRDRVYVTSGASIFVLTDVSLAPPPVYASSEGIITSMALGQSTPTGNNQPIETAFVVSGHDIVGVAPDSALSQNVITDFGSLENPAIAPAVITYSSQVLTVVPDGGLSSIAIGQRDQTTTVWTDFIPGAELFWPVMCTESAAYVLTGAGGASLATLSIISMDGGALEEGPGDYLDVPLVISSTGRVIVEQQPTMVSQAVVGFLAADGGLDSEQFVPPGLVIPQEQPVLGQDNLLYLVDTTRLTVLDTNLSPVWSLALAGGPSLLGSPNLDCARGGQGDGISGRPGTLYLSTPAGLLAVVVDSPGVTATSPWPMLAHDPSRTWNGAADLSAFSCP